MECNLFVISETDPMDQHYEVGGDKMNLVMEDNVRKRMYIYVHAWITLL